jgi:hypothetical protein
MPWGYQKLKWFMVSLSLSDIRASCARQPKTIAKASLCALFIIVAPRMQQH